MKMIDKPAELALKEQAHWCFALDGVKCTKLVCPNITPIQECGGGLLCGRAFVNAIQYELIEVCKKGFFLACAKFGDVVGPLCPFDPPRLVDKFRLEAQIEELKVVVEELSAKVK